MFLTLAYFKKLGIIVSFLPIQSTMNNTVNQFDVIIIGGGHAGTEAALASARLNANTLLITHKKETLGAMSCNPAIGGIGKSHLVKEIDALGGVMAHAADLAGIQFRILNSRKGPAVRATRAQADRLLYKAAIQQILEAQENLTILEEAVDDLIIEHDQVKAVITQSGLKFHSKAVVLTTGTFLNGKIHIGPETYAAGRMGDPPTIKLAEKLRQLPLHVGRLKTGTPARIDGRTIDFSVLKEQPGDTPTPVFSFLGNVKEHPRQVSCYVALTNEKTHDIIRGALNQSPVYSGAIKGVGPRYCPSIEDKVVRFSDKKSHQIFIEPEGLTTDLFYPNGISTGLPYEVQLEFIHTMKGFENACIVRPGYAIEYDFFDPRDLKMSLETKVIAGLFFAGQINGTTGYEEAAAQGLIAGLNAAKLSQSKEAWTPKRNEAYIGVLIDDLITKGTLEPYRMFTSRAEFRLHLREDNADLRLTPKGRALGLVDDERFKHFEEKQNLIEKEANRFRKTWVRPDTPEGTAIEELINQCLLREYSLMDLLKRPELTYRKMMTVEKLGPGVENDLVANQIEIDAKYSGYLDRQEQEIERLSRYEDLQIPKSFQYEHVKSLSSEVLQKFNKVKPETVGIASRIPGVTPAAISLLLVYLRKIKNHNIYNEEY